VKKKSYDPTPLETALSIGALVLGGGVLLYLVTRSPSAQAATAGTAPVTPPAGP
jgi:hypothetical protein